MSSLNKILDYLFVSKVRIKCLTYFYSRIGEKHHLREVSRDLREEVNAVRRELNRLSEIKFLLSEKQGNKILFYINENFLLFNELESVVFKNTGLGKRVLQNINKLGTVHFAVLTNTFNLPPEQKSQEDIDFVMVGKVDMNLLDSLIAEEEKRIGKEIHYTVLSLSEFELRKRRKEQFVLRILLGTKVLIYGNHAEYIKLS